MYQSHADQAAGRSHHTSHTGHLLGARIQVQRAETGTPVKCVIGREQRPPMGRSFAVRIGVGKVKPESWPPSKVQMWGLE